jgi:hypothetical protein
LREIGFTPTFFILREEVERERQRKKGFEEGKLERARGG